VVVVPVPDPPPPQPAIWQNASTDAAQMKSLTRASAVEKQQFIIK
jgi:hypothetical protein